jgi:hypothetical protein
LCQRGARSGDGRRLAGVGMAHLPSQGSRVEHPSHTGCARPFLERNEASRIRRRGNRAGKRKFAYTLETHTGRGVVGSSVVRKLQRPARPIRRRDRLHPGLRAELLVIRSDHVGLTIFSGMTGNVVTFPPQAAQVLTGPRLLQSILRRLAPVGACGSRLLGEGTIGHR